MPVAITDSESRSFRWIVRIVDLSKPYSARVPVTTATFRSVMAVQETH
jgi:hypothetical protein